MIVLSKVQGGQGYVNYNMSRQEPSIQSVKTSLHDVLQSNRKNHVISIINETAIKMNMYASSSTSPTPFLCFFV